jgi:elongation of very long chain fatty acids protein 4
MGHNLCRYVTAALKIKCPWKKYITQAQMLQFVIVFAHACFVIFDGHCPKVLPYSQMFVMSNMLVLFGGAVLVDSPWPIAAHS